MSEVADIEPDTGKSQQVEELRTDEIEGAIYGLVRRSESLQYRLLHLIGEFDRRNAWIPTGATSCATWLADACELEISTAREHVRVAHALTRLGLIDAAFGRGELSYTKVRTVTRVAQPHNEAELLELAMRCSARDLAIELAQRNAAELTPEELEAQQFAARSLSWRTEVEGTVAVSARLTPLQAASFCAVIDAAVMSRTDAPADASLAQQRADALVSLCEFGGSTDKGTKAEVLVHVHASADGSVEAVTRQGAPVPLGELQGLVDEASLRALIHDVQGRPIDASPARRFPTKRQRRVLEARDQCCAAPGCRAVVFLEAHHKKHVADGGTTTLDNLELRCRFHHQRSHRAVS